MKTDLARTPWAPAPAAEAPLAERFAWYADVARWAPSKHNTQPWRFVTGAAGMEIWLDDARQLPVTDPMQREAVIACGAALHLAEVAARATGHRTAVVLLPHGDTSPLARLVETGPCPADELDRALLTAAATRHTDRGPLDAAVLSPSLPFILQRAAYGEHAVLQLVTTPGDRLTLADLVARGAARLSRRDGADEELTLWLREPGDLREDGVSTSSTRGAAQSHKAKFVQRDFSSAESSPSHDRTGPDRPLVGVLCTPEDRPRDWLTAGRALAAILLRGAMEGAQASYLNQAVEEPALRQQLLDQLALPGSPQVVLRMGAGGPVARTPRRP